VDLQPPREEERAAIKRRFGMDAVSPLVLYMGDYDPAGAALAVAAALPRLQRQTRAHVVFACRPKGTGHEAIRAAVRAETRRGDPGRVHFVGTIPWAERLAASADVAVFPARRTPAKMDLPLALLQSLAAGVPAVVAESGPLGDLVRAGAAVGVSVDRPDDLADAATRLLADPAARRKACRAARSWSLGDGSVMRLLRQHEELYQELLGKAT
jgi:glycosyltransferase involved in cell wall biosynthesis